MKNKKLEIKCPECDEFIDINEQISHQLQEQSEVVKKEIEEEIKEEIKRDYSVQIESYRTEITDFKEILRKNEDSEKEASGKMQEMQYLLDTQDQQEKIKIQKATLDVRKEESEKYQKMAEDAAEQMTAQIGLKYTQLEMKNNELHDQMRQQREMHQEALRKAEQGSVQTQGEGGEIYIEDLLRQAFPFDDIQEVGKGQKGADIIQTVKFSSGIIAGKIVWEGKTAKTWSNGWISKVKDDTARVNGHISVIVTTVSKGNKSTKMTMIEENVWVCNYSEILALATASRVGLISTTKALKSQEGKGSKIEVLYDYMSSQEFVNVMRMISDSIDSEKDIINKERRAMEKNWKSREKAADAKLLGFAEFIGTIKTIATELPSIKEIEGNDFLSLSEPDDYK